MTLRMLAAAAVLVSAAVHLYMWSDWARGDDFLGPAFLLNGVSGLAITALLIAWRHWLPAFLAFGFGLSTLAGFGLATTVGLFGTTATWEGWEVWVSAAAEVVAIVAGGLLLIEDNPLRSRGQAKDHSPVGRAHLH